MEEGHCDEPKSLGLWRKTSQVQHSSWFAKLSRLMKQEQQLPLWENL